MFGLGFGEILIILVIALILLGPKKLPEAAKQLGKGLREFRKATDDLKSQFETEMNKPPEPPKVAEAPPSSHSEPTVAATPENVPGLDAATAEPPKQI
jgi:sec-independent protein translocase protein TatB